MGLWVALNHGFYGGGSVSVDVPRVYPIAIGGFPFVMDLDGYSRQTLDVFRVPYDNTDEPGEQSLTTYGIWRRHYSDWQGGAGQPFFDEPDSVRSQFFTSKGIDPWEKRVLKLQPDTNACRADAATNQKLLSVNGYLYVVDGTTAYFSQDPMDPSPTWTNANPQSHEGVATTITDIATDGSRIYYACGSNGIDRHALGATTGANFSTYAADRVWYAGGRVLAADGNDLSEISAAGTATTLLAHDNTAFVWSALTDAPDGIYVGGYTNDRSELYYVTVNQADGSLTVPIPTGPGLPEGEVLYAMQYYQGIIAIGTSLGVRIATVNGNGGLDVGPLIEINVPVKCFEPQGNFIWFGWTNYDATSTGLGRLYLGTFTSDGVPAYASDMMATGQGEVQGVVTFEQARAFSVSGLGVYCGMDELVEEGTWSGGWLRYSTFELKNVLGIDLRHHALMGQVAVTVENEHGDMVAAGASQAEGSLSPDQPLAAHLDGEAFQMHMTLSRHASDAELGPEVTRLTMRAMAVPRRTDEIVVKLMLGSKVRAPNSIIRKQAALTAWRFLKNLERARTVVTYQEGTQTYRVVVDKVVIEKPRDWMANTTFFETDVSVRMLTTEEVS